MVSSARRAINCILLVLGAAICSQAQTTAQKPATGSISGNVTIKGKPAVGVTLLAEDSRNRGSSTMTHYRARTDQTGSYRIKNLPAGTYEVSPITPALVTANQSDSIVISDGEAVADVNLSLVPGGVITGKITDSEGEPIIGQPVMIMPLDDLRRSGSGRMRVMRLYSPENTTDDRGVYRVFGLPAGKYKVYVGESSSGKKNSREYYRQTFYPSVTDAAKATIIEVTEGSETNHIDIVLGRPVVTFRVAGRLVDGENGKPIPNIKYGVGQTIVYDEHSSGSSSSSAGITNANGEFGLDSVTPGTYTIFTTPPDGSDVPPSSVTFEVVDRDLLDLLIKTTKGSSLSGVVVLEGNERVPNLLSGLHIYAAVESKTQAFTNASSTAVGQDGTFTINGVRSGPARLSLWSTDDRKQFEIVRVERNGIPQPETINVKDREQVAGIRVTVKYLKLTGAIRGQLKVEDGELPPASQLSLSIWPLDENLERKRTSSIRSPQPDARGRFFIEGLAAGTYQVTVYPSGQTRTFDMKPQNVTVTDDTVTEVTVIIKPERNPN